LPNLAFCERQRHDLSISARRGEYPPDDFGSPGYIGAGVLATGIAFGTGDALGRWVANGNRWGGGLNWRNHQINPLRSVNNINAANSNWTHNPAHRGGARYNNPGVAQSLHGLPASVRGGGFRGGGGGGGRGRRSDLRLKHDIALLGRRDNGIGVYRFIYNGGRKAYVGVIAQQVRAIRPDAVLRGSDGYLRVRYDKLGLRFQTYDR
jgi:hypothetical protein